jgi:Tol biopolymer transport system component
METPAKKCFYPIVLAGYLGLAGCGGGGSAPTTPPQPSLSQTVTLVNDVDIDYSARLTGISSATRTITRNGTQIASRTITYSPFTETLSGMERGDYRFDLTAGTLSDSDSLTIPNYDPTANFASLETNLNERYEGSSKTYNLESLIVDKNPEDRPVPITEARSLDGKTSVSVDGYNLTISAIGAAGPYQVEVNYGNDAGGRGSGIIPGQIIAVPEQIAFTGLRNGNFDIYLGQLVNGVLTNIQRLTTDPSQDFESAWSPYGDRIVFTSNRDGTNRIYSMNIDGSNQQVINPNIGRAMDPTWCSNGKILFNYTDSGSQGIASINPDGTEFKKIISEPFNGWLSGLPACSPDSLQIAFVSFRNGNPEIYVSKFDGSNQRNLTNNPAADDQPAWFPVYDNSPNGIIALITDRDTPGTGELNLYVINPDGTGLQRLTNFTGEELDLSLSPDLTRFLLTYGPVTGPWHIYMMNRNGTGLTQLTTEGQNRYPAWRPR